MEEVARIGGASGVAGIERVTRVAEVDIILPNWIPGNGMYYYHYSFYHLDLFSEGGCQNGE